MKKKIAFSDITASMHEQAEILLKRVRIETNSHLTENETKKLIQELKIHQAALEMQTEELKKTNEKAIELETEKQIALYGLAPSGYFTLSKSGDIENINYGAERLLGKESSHLKNNRFSHFLSLESRPVFNQFLAKIFKSKIKETCEVVISPVGSMPIYIQLNGISIENEKHCLVTAFDISEHKKTEKSLQDSEHKYRKLIENYPDAIIIYSEGKIEFANNESLRLMAVSSPIDLIGKPVLQFVHPDSRALLDRMKMAAKEGVMLPFAEEKFIRPNGTELNVEVNAISISYDNKLATQLIIRDITARKKAEEEKSDNEEKYRLIFDYSPLGILSFDENGVISACNDNFVKLIGSSSKSLVGLNMLNLPDKKLVSAVQTALDGSPGFYEDLYHSVTANKITPVRALFTTMFHKDGRVRGGVGIIEDITERKQVEEKIQFTLSRLKAFIDSNIIGIIIADKTGRIIEANDYYLNLTGFTRKDFENQKVDWRSMTPPEWLPLDEIAIGELIEKGKCTPYEKEYFRKDGSRIAVMITDTMLPGTENQIAGYIVDITERKKAEKELIVSRQRFHDLIELAVDGILTGSVDGVITDANSCFCTMVGRLKEEIIGLHISQSFFTADSLKRNPLDFDRLIKGDIVVNERNIFRPDGTEITIEMHTKMMPDQTYQSIFRDITERKSAEEALIKSNELLSLFIKNSPIYAYIKEVSPNESRVLRASENFIEMVGLPGSLMTGKTMQELFPKEFADKLTANDWEVTKTGKEIIIEEELNGRFYHTHKFPIKLYDKNLLAGYSIDVTDRIMFEKSIEEHNNELKLLNTEKDKFFSIIAHDLRSPFNVFLGFTQMMVDDLPKLRSEEIQKIALMMRNSANNLYSLLENLLEWSLIARGKTNYDPVSFLLLPHVQLVSRLVFEAAMKKNILCEVKVPADIVVKADENMLGSILRNLLINAVKYTSGGGKITIQAKELTNNMVEISIRDTGIGMNKEIIQKLFLMDEFTSRRGTAGEPSTGLGLIICKDFVEKNGGKIWVESEESVGSTFYFTIPI
jgi:PAS domain S-box-containing protein